jgi:hypothetical protein
MRGNATLGSVKTVPRTTGLHDTKFLKSVGGGECTVWHLADYKHFKLFVGHLSPPSSPYSSAFRAACANVPVSIASELSTPSDSAK